MNRALNRFCRKVARLGWALFALDAGEGNPKDWITLENGVHVPVKEGQSKKEATNSFVAKKETQNSASLKGVAQIKAIQKLNSAVKELAKTNKGGKESEIEQALQNMVDAKEEAEAAGAIPKGTGLVDVVKPGFFSQYGKELNTKLEIAEEPVFAYTNKEQGGSAESASSEPQPDAWERALEGEKAKGVAGKLKAAEYKGIMTDDQKQALNDYSGSAYQDINTALRTRDEFLLNKTKKHVEDLDDIFVEAFTSKPMIVYRGVEINEKIPWVNSLIHEELEEQGSITEKGFLSTSASKKVAEERFAGGILIKIAVPAGSRGVSLGKLSKKESEKEILFDRGYTLGISRIKTKKEGNGKVSYTIETILQ